MRQDGAGQPQAGGPQDAPATHSWKRCRGRMDPPGAFKGAGLLTPPHGCQACRTSGWWCLAGRPQERSTGGSLTQGFVCLRWERKHTLAVVGSCPSRALISPLAGFPSGKASVRPRRAGHESCVVVILCLCVW